MFAFPLDAVVESSTRKVPVFRQRQKASVSVQQFKVFFGTKFIERCSQARELFWSRRVLFNCIFHPWSIPIKLHKGSVLKYPEMYLMLSATKHFLRTASRIRDDGPLSFG